MQGNCGGAYYPGPECPYCEPTPPRVLIQDTPEPDYCRGCDELLDHQNGERFMCAACEARAERGEEW